MGTTITQLLKHWKNFGMKHNVLRSFLVRHTKALEGHTNVIFCHEVVMRAFQYLLSRDPTVLDRIRYENCAVVEWCESLDAIKNI